MNKLFIPGVPISSARPRVTRNGTFLPKKSREYKKTIQEHYIRNNGGDYGDVPVEMMLWFIFPIPKSYSKKKRKQIQEREYAYMGKPDIDNLEKSIMDALNGLAYKDDAQVVSLFSVKTYTERPEDVGVRIIIGTVKEGIIGGA